MCEGDDIEEYDRLFEEADYDGLDELGCKRKFEGNWGKMVYNDATNCPQGTQCKHGSKCGVKGTT